MILSVKYILKGALIFLTLLLVCINSKSQNITLQNPSFEGPKGSFKVPSPWIICNNSPDTQPGTFGVTLAPFQGNTYLGLTTNFGPAQEVAGQLLLSPMLANKIYSTSIMLAQIQIFLGGIGELQIWGGVNSCNKDELLWSSNTIKNTTWVRYNPTFKPTQNLNYLLLVCHYFGGDSPYILIDNIGNLYDVNTKPKIFITSPTTNSNQVCLFNVSGKTDSIPTQVKLKSQYLDTLTASLNLTDTSWSVNLDYSKQKFCITRTDTLIAIGYFNTKIATDTIVISVVCKYDSCNTVLPLIKIPNLITPNDDGRNETFEIVNLPSNHKLEIFNRWGQRVFESSDYKNDWAGDEGVYYYMLNTGNEICKGWVQIVK